MRATMMNKAGDDRIDNTPDASIQRPTNALLRVTRAYICGSELWPYKLKKPDDKGQGVGHEAIGVVEAIGKAEALRIPLADGTLYALPAGEDDALMPDVLEGRIEPGRVFDREVGLDGVPDGYRAMDQRESIKVMVRF